MAMNRSAGVAPVVDLWSPFHASNEACWEIRPGFETQGGIHQKSKTLVTVVLEGGFMLSKT